MRYRANPNGYVIKLSIGDEISSSLIEFGRKERIDSAHFWGIGAAKGIVLGSYDLRLKTYRKAELSGIWEIASLTGSLAHTEDGPILHIHGVFSDENCLTRGGHVFTLVCAATVEIFLVTLSPGLARRYDEVTGLKLLDL
jgi:predicted DNA-binding protein with PD1-like motif